LKSLRLYGIQDLRYEEVEIPTIEYSTDVIVKVKSVGICGSDISRYKKLGPYIPGMVWGHEFSGEVVEVGNDVKNVKPGDRVAGCPAYYCGGCESCKKGEFARCDKLTVIGALHPGAFAEYIKIPSENLVLIPDNVDYDTAAIIEPSAVAIHGLYKTNLKPGDEIAVVGCGNIGLLTILWAKIFGAKTIYAIDIDDQKLEVAKEIGADVLINSLEKTAYIQIMDITNERGVDIAVESAGSPISSAQVFSLAKKGGKVVFMGIPYADVNIERFYFEKIVRSELQVFGSWNAISSPFPGKEWATTVHFMKKGNLDVGPLITHKLKLSEGPRTFEKILKREEFFGKVILHPEWG
jgi:L-iditol 2-dehydrogenase